MDVSIDIFLCMACMTFIFSPTYSARPGQCYRYPQWRYLMRRTFFKGWKRFFHLQKWYILHFFNLLWRLIFGLKTQKTPLDHVLDSKMQTTRRVGVLATLFERYDPNKAFQKKFWVPVTWEKILETSKVREAISQNSLFELILTEPGWFLVPRLKNHY